MQYDNKTLVIRDYVANFKVEQGIDVNTLFILLITQHLNDGSTLLDVGTGNGFVLSQILQNSDKQVQFFGIDNSSEMVKLAVKNLANKAKITEANIGDMPFDDCSFDIVTAKNVTRIDATEIFRVLKGNGIFIFREYGYGKGMIEIAEMFSGRIIRQRKPDYYKELLCNAGFKIFKFDEYEIARKYNSAQELVSVVKSFPFVENFAEADEKMVLEKFAKDATITSDPFILVAIKPKGDR
ncbi:MAG: class I SAM-dependent methyltransferase [Candidatus Moranbacteria bacterium]|nr:class I SAM-dependent methyltransferase [Candidatus Moranbacteria bacterium]